MTGTPSQDGFAVAITVSDAAVRDALAGVAAAASDMTAAFDDVGNSLVLSVMRRFDGEHAPDGTPWQPLKPETILRRLGGASRAYTKKGALRKPAARKLAALKILHNRGHLRSGIHHRASADGVEIGSADVYARIHQFGGKAGRNHAATIPARPFLGLDAADETMIVDTLRRHLAATVLPGGEP